MRAPNGDDALFVQRIKRKDSAAWESFYKDIYPRLRAFVSRRVDGQLVTDIVAATMAKAVASIGQFDSDGVGLSAWVFGICRHVVADNYRAASREQRQPAAQEHTSGDVGDVGEAVESDEETKAMRAAYAMLSDDDREILDLRVIARLTAEDVGELLGRQPGAVRMAQSRALERLRGHFKEVYQ